MNHSIELVPSESEVDRQKLLAELHAEQEADWENEYAPGSFGCHELLDRTSLILQTLDSQILNHPACVLNPTWFDLAEEASAALAKMYQLIGEEHLSK